MGDCEGVHIAVAEKPKNYYKEISRDFPFKGREAVKQKGLHGGWEGGIAKVYILHAVEEKPENHCKEISQDFPFKGREAVKQKGLHGGWDGRLRRCTNCTYCSSRKSRITTVKKSRGTFPLKGA